MISVYFQFFCNVIQKTIELCCIEKKKNPEDDKMSVKLRYLRRIFFFFVLARFSVVSHRSITPECHSADLAR